MSRSCLGLCVLALLLSLHRPAAAEVTDDPGMRIMRIMMMSPSISADGKEVAIYSFDPGKVKGAKTSLAVFGAAGALKKRLSIVPPMVDLERSKGTAMEAALTLTGSRFARMGLVAKKAITNVQHVKAGDPKASLDVTLSSGDATFKVHVADRVATVTATRAGKSVAPITLKLGKSSGTCGPVIGYTIQNTLAGFDETSGALALSVDLEDANSPTCFGYDFVASIK